MEALEKWDRRFLELARTVSGWSKDPSTQVGVVLVQPDLRQVVGLGYNGFPRGVWDSDERLADREVKYPIIVHAEVNAIIQAGHAARGAELYVYPSFAAPPLCCDCAGAAIQAGIITVIGYRPAPDSSRQQRWAESTAVARMLCAEAGMKIRMYDE